MSCKPTVEDPWTWRDKLVHLVTGRVSAHVYRQRIEGMLRDEHRSRARPRKEPT